MRRLVMALGVGVHAVIAGCSEATFPAIESGADGAELQRLVDSTVATLRLPGAVVAVRVNGGSDYLLTSGVENLSSKSAMPFGNRFRVGSITKTMVATIALQLVGEGSIALTDSIARWLPGVVPNANRITLRMLLNNTSGVPDYIQDPAFQAALIANPGRTVTTAETLAAANRQTRKFEPGAVGRWEYSNTNYVLLGLVAKKAGSASYSALLRRLVLEPLALRGTFVAGEDSIVAARAHSHVDINGDGKADDLSALVPDPAMTRGAGGAGAIVATAIDVAMFARAYFTGTLVSDSLHQAATRWRDRGDNRLYGFGTIAWPVGADTLLGHMGNTAGQSAGVWHSKAAGITAVILSNVHGVPMSAAVQRLLTEAEKIRGAR